MRIPRAALGVLLVAGLVVAAPAAAADEPHRIGVDAGRLFDRVTGAEFVSRGANYIRLAEPPTGGAYHANFEPSRYSAADAQGVLDGLKASGYNTVRVFIDPGDGHYNHGLITDASPADGLNQSYLDNVADFVRRAAKAGVYVMPVLEAFPLNSYYLDIVRRVAGRPSNPEITGNNQWYLNTGFIEAKKQYMRNFAGAMRARLDAGTSAILAYSISNEAFWETSQLPLSRDSGTFTGPDGVSYDLAKPDQRQQVADAGMVLAANAAVAGVRAAEPEALVTIGFFTNHAVAKPGYDGFATHCSTSCQPGVDYRYPGRPASISTWSQVDFLDLHVYPRGDGYALQADLDSVEVSVLKKLYVLGEFGAHKPAYGGNVTTAAYGMRDTQVESCRISKAAKGWLFWTWDSDVVPPVLASQDQFFSLASAQGAINGTLAPVVRPDPCRR